MGREGEWTPTPGGTGPAANASAGFSGTQQNSGFARPPMQNPSPPGSWGPPLGNNSGPQGGPRYGPSGLPLQPGSASATLPWSGPPAFRAPSTSGPPNAGPPGVRPLSANSTPVPAIPGQGLGGGPPARFGLPQQTSLLSGSSVGDAGRGISQQPGGFSQAPPSNALRGPPVGPPGTTPPPPPAASNYSRPTPSLPTPPISDPLPSSQAPQFPSVQQRNAQGPFPGGPASGPAPSSGTVQPPSWGPRGPPHGPPTSQQFGPPSSQQFGPTSSQQFGPPSSQQYGPTSSQQFGPSSSQQFGTSSSQQFGTSSSQQYGPAPSQQFGPPFGQQLGPPSGQQFGQSGQLFGPPPSRISGPVASFSQESTSLSASFQNMNFGAQSVPPPPTFGTTTVGSGQRIYPDASGANAPPTGMIPQPYPPIPGPGMGHPPGVGAQPGSPATQNPQSGTSRIDPNQIPRPLPGAAFVEFETRLNGQANLPPSATTNFLVKDMGNCSPRFMRCTLNQIPCSGDLLGTSSMPLAVMVQPFALLNPSEEQIPIVDFGESGPVRCSRCKAYVNPFMKFVDQGRRFSCNLCGFSNETPRDYHCNLGPDGRRRDADERPELSKGTVEFVASKEYLIRPPMPAVYYFLIDVSANAVQTGAVAASCSALNRVLGDLPDGPRTMVGIATFDSTIHFYSLNNKLQQAGMLVVPDIQDVYTPLQSDLIVPLVEAREHLEQLLESIPSMFQSSRVPESAFGAAVKGAFLAMKSTGGKLLVFQSVLPSVGFGGLSPRESEGRVGGEKEYLKLLQPSDKVLKTMAIELAEFQVCVELFIMSQQYVDITSLSVVPRTTGGQVYYYHPFYAGADSAKLYNDLRWNVTRPQGLEAVMRVRCSQGLQVQEYFGNFSKRIPTDVDLPAIDCDKTIMVTFKHDDKFQEGTECCFQCALLYTTLKGERRIRVITLSLSCTTVLSNLFRGADLDAQFTYLLKHAAQEVPTVPLSQVRDQITSQCVNILYTYRKFCATASSSGQLILPEALKLLPLYTLALTKSVGLRTDARSDTHVDERAYWISRVASLPAALSIPLVYPRMFAIHNLPSKDALQGAVLPDVVPLSSENLDHDGIFLLEMGEDAYLYVGKQASAEILQQLFGVSSVDEVPTGQFVLPVHENELSKRVNEIINEIRRQRCSYLRLRLVRRGDPLEFSFFSFLVEDKSSAGLSYVEFLVHVHRQIQSKMT